MGSFIIEGGHRLQGEVIPQGAKNEALQILCAVMLTAEPVTIHNLPDIVDVNKLINLLGDLGVKTQHLGPGSWRFEADDVNLDHLKSDSFRTKGGALRGSVMILGPMLGRFGNDTPQSWPISSQDLEGCITLNIAYGSASSTEAYLGVRDK